MNKEKKVSKVKTVTIAGLEQFDFAYYLAKIGTKLNKTVIVVDNSAQEGLMKAVTNFEDHEPCVSHERFSTVSRANIVSLKESVEKVEDESLVILNFAGCDVSRCDIEKADLIIYCLSFDRLDNQLPSEIVKKADGMIKKGKTIAVIFNKAANKLHVNDVMKETGLDAKGVLTVDADMQDIAMRQALLINGSQKLKGLSEGYLVALEECAKEIYEVDEKAYKKYVR